MVVPWMTRRCAVVFVGVLVLAGCSDSGAAGDAATYDLVLRGGWVVDGTGAPRRRADVAIEGESIAAVGDLGSRQATRVLDVTGLHVTPGFIDAHSHAAPGLATPELSGAEPLLAQGITTVVVNPDGGGALDLRQQRRKLLEHGLGVNVVQLVPFGAIRVRVMKQADRKPTDAELVAMQGLVRAGMEAGAFGLSTGLFYAPQSFAETEEVIALARVAGEFGGVYQSHIRDESDYDVGLVAAVEEAIRITRASGLTGVITHIKALGPNVWGRSRDVVGKISEARRAGVPVYADQYPYDASATNLYAALVPRRAQAGGRRGLARILKDPQERKRLVEGMAVNLARRGGAERLRFTARKGALGRTLADVARERGRTPVEAALELLGSGGGTSVISFNMQADDILRFMRQPWTMTSSDGGLVPIGRGRPHPRNYGTFPRKLRKYVLEEHVLTLEQAIHGMCGLTAQVFGIQERGVIRAGARADLAVFDPDHFRDRATYEDPHQLAVGMVHLLVNGRLAILDGQPTGTRAGQVLAR